MPLPLLSIQNLSISFPSTTSERNVVDALHLDIAKGETFALVGESGSGKSVSMLSLMQLLPPHTAIQGTCLFSEDGEAQQDLISIDADTAMQFRGRKIAMIFQEPMTSLNPLLTCGEQITEVLRWHESLDRGASKGRMLQLLEAVRLPHPKETALKYPHQLSGGQRQRVMIAMAMSCQPALLIADEPTTALDVSVQREILLLLKELQIQTGMTLLLITHNLGIVADVADRMAVMYRGKLMEQGWVKDVLQSPQHPYTRALLQCQPALYEPGQRLPVVEEGVFSANKTSQSLPDLSSSTPILLDEEPILKVNQLSVSWNNRSWWGKTKAISKWAVDRVSLTVKQGETLGLVGESGCGKTSLGKAILNIIPVQSGSIEWKGLNLLELNPREMRKIRKEIQMVFQDPFGALNPRKTIGEAILEPIRQFDLHGNRSQQQLKVKEWLERVDLDPSVVNRYPHQFSGGQRQRICIARALAAEPLLVVFDESVSALDVSVQAQILNLINDLKKALGFSALFISHDLAVVKYIADRIMVMQAGRVVEEGEAQQLFHFPQHPYTQQLIDAIPGRWSPFLQKPIP